MSTLSPPGTVEALLRGICDRSQLPVLQCIGVHVKEQRLVLAISDGKHWTRALALPPVLALVKEEAIQNGTLIRLNDHSLADIRGDKVLILTAIEALGQCSRIGAPLRLDGTPWDPCQASTRIASEAVECSQPTLATSDAATSDGDGCSCRQIATPRRDATESQQQTLPATPVQHARTKSIPITPVAPLKTQPLHSATIWHTCEEGTEGEVAKDPSARRALHLDQLLPEKAGTSLQKVNLRTVPISHLNPWRQRWAVRVKVLWSSGLRQYGGGQTGGMLLRAQLADQEGGEMSAVAFNAQAERLQAFLQPESVVILSRGALKPAAEGPGFELVMDKSTTVELCHQAVLNPRVSYRFRRLADLEQLPVNSRLDVAGLCDRVAPATLVTTKYGNTLRKRSLVLKDDSMCTVELTLWGPAADDIGAELEQRVAGGEVAILAVKAARRSEWFGPTLSSEEGRTRFEVEPAAPRVQQLREWYDGGGRSLDISAFRELSKGQTGTAGLGERTTLADIKGRRLAEGETLQFLVKATIVYLDSDCVYAACSSRVPETRPPEGEREGKIRERQCQKRMRDDSEGLWYCETCCQRSTPEWRFRLNLGLEDHTAKLTCIAFDDVGAGLIGAGAAKVRQLQVAAESGDIEADREVGFGGSSCVVRRQSGRELVLQLRAATRVWRNIPQTQFFLSRFWDIDFGRESVQLLASLRQSA